MTGRKVEQPRDLLSREYSKPTQSFRKTELNHYRKMKSQLQVFQGTVCLLFFAGMRTHALSVIGGDTKAPALPPPPSRDNPSVNTKESVTKSSRKSYNHRTRRSATRREILGAATAFSVAASSLPCILIAPQSATAAAPLDAGEAIRRGAANIPGYGSSDVFYPESFAGSWKVTRDVEFPSSASPSSPPPVLRLTYPVRFITSIEDDAVVADRGYNQAELEAALARRGSASSSPTVLSYDWVANNPNVVKVALADGTKKEIKVTKRATERTNNTVSSSEFQRITQEDTRQTTGGLGGIPQISARRVVSKWKTVDNSTLEGIEIVYAVGGGGDPLSTSLTGSDTTSTPTILSKSRLYLVR